MAPRGKKGSGGAAAKTKGQKQQAPQVRGGDAGVQSGSFAQRQRAQSHQPRASQGHRHQRGRRDAQKQTRSEAKIGIECPESFTERALKAVEEAVEELNRHWPKAKFTLQDHPSGK